LGPQHNSRVLKKEREKKTLGGEIEKPPPTFRAQRKPPAIVEEELRFSGWGKKSSRGKGKKRGKETFYLSMEKVTFKLRKSLRGRGAWEKPGPLLRAHLNSTDGDAGGRKENQKNRRVFL